MICNRVPQHFKCIQIHSSNEYSNYPFYYAS